MLQFSNNFHLKVEFLLLLKLIFSLIYAFALKRFLTLANQLFIIFFADIVKARRIYRFIESYSRDTWNVPARRLLQLNEADIMRIRDNYEDALEMRYQMVLRWIRTFKIGKFVHIMSS